MTPGGDELSIPANLKSLSEIRQFVRDAAGKAGCPDQAIGELTLAVDEACSNILTHGYENGEGRIGVAIRFDTGEIEIRIEDEAPLYDPFVEAPVPDVTKPRNRKVAASKDRPIFTAPRSPNQRIIGATIVPCTIAKPAP